jgi:hypothetical protein
VAEDKHELLQHYGTSRADFMAAIAGLGDQQLTDTSIDGWSIKDHMCHIAFWDELRALDVLRISAGHESAWRLKTEPEDELNKIAYAMRRDLSLEQVKWEFISTRRRLLDAISSSTPRGLDPSYYGEPSLRSTHEADHMDWIKRWRHDKSI